MDNILVTDEVKERFYRQMGIDVRPKQRSPMSPLLIIVALLAAAVICVVEGASSTLVIILAVAAFVVALFTELNWRERFAPPR